VSSWGQAFISRLLRSLRDQLCGPKRSHGKLSEQSQAVLAALATWIVREFHIDSPSATALAALVLIAIGKATKKALCDMKDEEVLEALQKA
jgi:hypothetical protein